MDSQRKVDFRKIIKDVQSRNVRPIAFAYKQVGPTFEDESSDLTLIALLGLKPMNHSSTKKATESCKNAGVQVILFSEEDESGLEAMAQRCGLPPNSGGIVVDGDNFRNSSDNERNKMVDKISVMKNSTPSDKLLLVQCLKKKGQHVTYVGFARNDITAIKEADVGIVMGTWSSEMARNSSDIFVWDGGFSFLVEIFKCGRSIQDNIRKYIQLELTMIIGGFSVIIITYVSSGHCPITSIYWFWATQLMAIAGSLALLTEPLSDKHNQKARLNEPLITKAMWRNILTQAAYQIAVLMTLQFKAESIFQINKKVMETMVLNTFITCQVFNQFNARHQETKNVFKGIHENRWFWVATAGTLALQLAYVEIAHLFFGNARLNAVEWQICLLIGVLSWAIDFSTKSISDIITYNIKPLLLKEPATGLELHV